MMTFTDWAIDNNLDYEYIPLENGKIVTIPKVQTTSTSKAVCSPVVYNSNKLDSKEREILRETTEKLNDLKSQLQDIRDSNSAFKRGKPFKPAKQYEKDLQKYNRSMEKYNELLEQYKIKKLRYDLVKEDDDILRTAIKTLNFDINQLEDIDNFLGRNRVDVWGAGSVLTGISLLVYIIFSILHWDVLFQNIFNFVPLTLVPLFIYSIKQVKHYMKNDFVDTDLIHTKREQIKYLESLIEFKSEPIGPIKPTEPSKIDYQIEE